MTRRLCAVDNAPTCADAEHEPMIDLIVLLLVAGVVAYVGYLVVIHLVKQSPGIAGIVALVLFLIILLGGWGRGIVPVI